MAQRGGIRLGKIRAPRIWSAGKAVGQTADNTAMGDGRRGAIQIKSPEEGREVIRHKKSIGVDQIKLGESLSGEILKGVVEEAHRLGFAVISHSLNIFASAEAGVNAVEHHWCVGLTSIGDREKKAKLVSDRWSGKSIRKSLRTVTRQRTSTKIIDAMVEKNVSWSPTIATWFRPLSPSAPLFRERELSILDDPVALGPTMASLVCSACRTTLLLINRSGLSNCSNVDLISLSVNCPSP